MEEQAQPGGDPSRAETRIGAATLALVLALKIVYALRYRINSDEGQHLHVAWGWTQGLVPYRDLIDNHPPLFHALFAPVVAVLGERPDVVVLSRLVLIPLFLLSLVAVHRLAHALFGARVALWSVVTASVLPAFFLTTTEVRPDDLSTALSLCGLVLLYDARSSTLRSYLAGLCLGAAAITSLKSIVLVGMLPLGALLANARILRRFSPVPAGAGWLATGLGVATPALSMLLGLAGVDALEAFFAEVLHRDLVGTLSVEQRRYELTALVPVSIPVAWIATRRIAARIADPIRASHVAGLFASTTFALVAILALSPELRPQDCLGLLPLACVLLVGCFADGSGPRLARLRAACSPARGLLLVTAIELLLLVVAAPPWKGPDVTNAARIRDTLRLTDAGELVMDMKGELVFRPRAARLVLERITRAQLAAGLVADDIPEQLAAAGTAVAVHDNENLPPRTRRFLNENYVNVGRVRVLGRFVPTPEHWEFEIAVPARYTVVTPEGPVPEARIDGTAIGAGRRLEVGHHRLEMQSSSAPLALLWAQASERGFSPFRVEGVPEP